MTPRPEVLDNRTIGGEKPLRVSWELEALHVPLPLAGRLVRVLRAVVEVAMLAMFHSGEHFSLRRAIAFELVRNDHPWDVFQPFKQLAEKLLRGVLVPTALRQNVEHIAILIHRPPQIVPFAVDRQKDLIEVPLVAWSRAPVTQLIRMRRSWDEYAKSCCACIAVLVKLTMP